MRNLLSKHRLAFLLALILFIMPFFWHRLGEVDYGGDSTRLYFYNHTAWLKNIALYSINSLPPFGEAIPNFSLIPFLFLLSLLKKILFDSAYLLNNFVNGLVLSGSFITVYFIADELFNLEASKPRTRDLTVGALGTSLRVSPLNPRSDERGIVVRGKLKGKIFPIVSGLFFCFSPLLIYSWERALYSFHYQLLAYPLFFLFILQYLKYGGLKYLFFATLTSLLFAMNFSFPGLPWLLAFFLFALPFFIFLARITGNSARLLKGLILLFVFCLLVNSFDIIPNVYTFINPSFESTTDIKAYHASGLSYFLSVYPQVRLVYNLTGQDQYNITSGFENPLQKLIYDFGIKYLFLYFLYPITIVLGLIWKNKVFAKKGQQVVNLFLLFFLIILFFMNAGFSSIGLSIYKLFFHLPLFSIFRAYYSKFATVYIFFYSLLLGISLKIIFAAIKNSVFKHIYIFSILFLIGLNAWPLISGKIVNSVLWKSDAVSISTQFNPDYQIFVDYLSKEKGFFKVLGLPLTNENYQVLRGKEKGVYFGPSTLGVLAGKNAFLGTVGFSIFWPAMERMIVIADYTGLNKLFGLLNIGYLFYDSDNYIYDSFPVYPFFPYSDLLKSIFPDQKAISEFIANLNLDKVFSISSFNLFKIKNPTPLFYIPEKIILVGGKIEALADIACFEDRQTVAYRFLNQSEKGMEKSRFSNEFAELYLKAEPEGISRLTEDTDFQNQVFYPFVGRKSRLIWHVSLLMERYQQWLQRQDPKELALQDIFYANKRINEIISFGEFLEERIDLYQEKINEVRRLILTIPDEKERLWLANLLSANLRSNLWKLENEGKKISHSLLEEFITESLKFSESLKGDFDHQKIEYTIDMPIKGEYEILVKNVFYQRDTPWLVLNGQKIMVGKNSLREDHWVSFGRVSLQEGKTNLTMVFKNSLNLLDRTNWQERQSAEQSKYIYQEILNRTPESWYAVKGELKEKGELKVIVAEKIGKPNDRQRRLSDLSGYRIIKEAVLNERSKKFSLNIKFSYGAKSAGIFIYDQGTGNFEKDRWRQTLSSLQVEEMVIPSVIFKLIKEKTADLPAVPKIFMRRITPAKYELSIEEARQPYNLVMSHAFDKGWRIYFEDQRAVLDGKHDKINGYANLWQINPEDSGGRENYKLIVEYWPQRLFYVGGIISLGSIFILFFCCLQGKLFK